jgi:DNA-binding transcriptional LysR family regulator
LFTELKKLKTFMVIAEEMSLTRAAARLGMAQPSVSDQLGWLEDMIGDQLVRRYKGRLYELTPAGTELQRIARKLLIACAEADDEARLLTESRRIPLVVGVEPTTLYIPERNALIARFLARTGHEGLKVVSCRPAELVDGLRTGRFDLILASSETADDDVEALPLYDYALCLAVPKQSADLYQPAFDGELRGVRLMMMRDSYHPFVNRRVRAGLAEDEIDWVDCPEDSYAALMHHAMRTGIATLTPAFAQQDFELREAFDIRPLRRPLRVNWSLMRRRGYQKRQRELFWRMAQRGR